jgi:dihydroneopterin aldolase
MATDMKEEFEAYVKKLTISIFKDILLKKMEKLCSKYEDEYEKYEQTSEKVLLASESLQGEIKKADEVVKNIDTNTKISLQSISQDIVKMENSTKEMFEEMREFHSQSKSDFIMELSNYIDKYKNEVAMTLDSGYEQISDKLAGVITPELLQEFIDKMEENTRESKEITMFINDAYKNVVEESFNLIEALAEQIAQTLLAAFELIGSLEVTVYKPQAPVKGDFEYFAVKIKRFQK